MVLKLQKHWLPINVKETLTSLFEHYFFYCEVVAQELNTSEFQFLMLRIVYLRTKMKTKPREESSVNWNLLIGQR